jgi:UDP-N-acetyl-2-amino-2-deoxyglucuronate dehydrogenase
LEAIHSTGNKLAVAIDINDSVGILDRYFQDVAFFTNFEDFYNYLQDNPVDYISICSPNNLHKSHIAFALRNNTNVICEKPLVLTESDLDELIQLEKSVNVKVNTVLQLRFHKSILELKSKIDLSEQKTFDVDLTYITCRGPWFHESWKGDLERSGGLAANIGIHFFDMLVMLFGKMKNLEVHHKDNKLVSGYLELERANIKWILSVDNKHLPKHIEDSGKTTFRSITVDGEEIEFSGGFTELHNQVYTKTLEGKGFGLEDARVGIQISEQVRCSEVDITSKNFHPKLKDIYNG